MSYSRETPTIDDIAKAAGVSPSTVSRALTRPERVNTATRQHIEEIAREMGYARRPYRRGSGPSLQHTIATVVADLDNPFSSAFLDGAQRQLNAAGYAQLLIDYDESAELEFSMIRRVRDRVDGLILASTRIPPLRLEALGSELPLVTLNRRLDNSSTVIIDTPSGYGGALEHLISLGHRRVIYVSGPEDALMNGQRWQALSSVAKTHGIHLTRTLPVQPLLKSGAAAADAVVNANVTACIAFNDLVAIGILQRFTERGIRVPGQISVIGCDDIFGAAFCNPPLTTVMSPLRQAGRSAVSILLDEIEHGRPSPPRRVVLPTYVTVRASTGPAPTSTSAT